MNKMFCVKKSTSPAKEEKILVILNIGFSQACALIKKQHDKYPTFELNRVFRFVLSIILRPISASLNSKYISALENLF